MKKRILAIVLVLTMIVPVLSICASAANVCSEIKGNCKEQRTFTVETGKRGWFLKNKLTFTQTKGKMSFYTWGGGTKDYSMYGRYRVTYENLSSGKEKTKLWTGKNLTLTLDKNTTYKITVTPASHAELNAVNAWKGAFDMWSKNSTWKVTGTKGVDLCT